MNYKRIYACLKSCGEDNEFLHDMLPEWTGKSSLKELTADEINTVCKNLMSKAAVAPKGVNYRTQKQYGKIMALAGRIGYDTARLNGFIQKTTGKQNVNRLSVPDAGAVITGLSKIALGKNNSVT